MKSLTRSLTCPLTGPNPCPPIDDLQVGDFCLRISVTDNLFTAGLSFAVVELPALESLLTCLGVRGVLSRQMSGVASSHSSLAGHDPVSCPVNRQDVAGSHRSCLLTVNNS